MCDRIDLPGAGVLRLDPEDAPALEHKEGKILAGCVMVKAVAWRRWVTLSQHLTGTECAHRNGDVFDFRRENLIPALRPWKAERRKWT